MAALKSALRGLGHPVSDEADRKTAQAALNKSLPFLLKHFPLWAVTNLSIGSRIPLIPAYMIWRFWMRPVNVTYLLQFQLFSALNVSA